VTTSGVEDNDIPANEISLSKLVNGTAGAFLRRNASGVVVEDAAVALQNLLTNAGFGVWSNSDTNKGRGSLTYDNLSGTFSVGEAVTGGTSGAVGKVIADSGSVLTLGACAERFQDNEEITGGDSAATADVNMPDSAAGVDMVKNGDFSVDTDPPPGWSTADATLTTEGAGQVGNCIMVANTANGTGAGYQEITVVPGKKYKCTVYFKKGTGTTGGIRLFDVSNAATIKFWTSLTDAGWTAYTYTFEAPASCISFRIFLYSEDPVIGKTAYFDEISCYEITPCCTGNDALGPDGWTKTNSLDIYRIQQDTTHLKALYGTMAVKTAAGAEYLTWQGNLASLIEHYSKFLGETFAIGVWVYSVSAADNVKAEINDSDGKSASGFAGADVFVWLEIARSSGGSITSYSPRILLDGDVGDIAYISCPMLAKGSSIGEGNYNVPPGEVIRFEKDIVLRDYAATATSDTDDVVDVESQAEAMTPKGIKELYVTMKVRDSAIANDIGAWMGPDTTYCAQSIGDVGVFTEGLGNDKYDSKSGWVRCNAEGDPWLFVNASGSGTLDLEIRVQGVRF